MPSFSIASKKSFVLFTVRLALNHGLQTQHPRHSLPAGLRFANPAYGLTQLTGFRCLIR